MKTPKLLLSLFFLFVLIMSSCQKDDDTDSDVVSIEGDIDAATTWDGDKVYVIRAGDFRVNSTLTIQAGAVIKFHPSRGAYLTLDGSGIIVARGTADKPVIFTSYRDDENGGDTNKDDDTTQPGRKDWGCVSTNGRNGSVFEYCRFLYGGNSTNTSSLSIGSGSVATVRYCLFAHNDGGDASGRYGALDASGAGAGTLIQNSVFFDNIQPLSVNDQFDLDHSNLFHNPDNVSVINQYNGIFVYTTAVASALSWGEDEVPYVIDDADWQIDAEGTLTLADHVVLKFKAGSYLFLVQGPAALSNYDGTDVFFTSWRDDAHGGDTNGDRNATTPANNDWGGIYNSISGTWMTWVNILYDSI